MAVSRFARRLHGTRAAWALGLFLLMLLPACDDSSTAPGRQNLVIRLTDAPIDELESVNVFFVDLTVKRRGSPVEDNVPLVLSGADNPMDILTLSDQIVPLAAGSVEPGTYEFIRVNLDESQSFVVESDGDQKDLKIPSREVKILGTFEIQDDGTTTLLLDFDAERSMVKTGPPRGEGGWLLKPVIVFAQGS